MMYHSNMRIEDMPKICGYYATAKHLKNRGYTIEQTLWMLLKTTVRK